LESLLFKDLITGENLWGWNQKQFGMFGLENVQLWCLRPDRKALAVVGEGGGCQYDHCIRIWGKDSEYQLLEEIPPDGPAFEPSKLQFLRWSPDGTRLAAFSEGGGLATWNVQTRKLLSNTQIGQTDNLQWSPGNRYLAALPSSWNEKLTAFVVDGATGKPLFSLDGITGATLDHVVWGPNGRSLAVISQDHGIRIWATASGKLLQTIPGHAIEWVSGGRRLVILTEDQTVQLYNAETGRLSATLPGHTFLWSGDGLRLVIIADQTVQLYDAETGRLSLTLKASAAVNATAFSPDNRRLATAGSDGAIQVWDVATGKPLFALTGHVGPVVTLSWRSDGSQLFSYGSDGTLRLWDARDKLTPTATAQPTLVWDNRPIPEVKANNQWRPQFQSFDGVEMALVPPGCFMMGSADGGRSEKPVNKQCFDKPFWIDKTEVTQKQFKALGGVAAEPSFFEWANHPVEQITWLEARDFCAKRGTRLPTEAEWEYAARGPDNLVYPWGNTFDGSKVVWLRNGTVDVGSLPGGASWVGALDLSGNVAEWVSTLYKPYPYNKDDGRESNSDTGGSRVMRGGGWSSYEVPPTLFSASARVDGFGTPSSTGFRCVQSYGDTGIANLTPTPQPR
jgi:formylglycine-generating enzyme required for sulfatase activity